MALGTISPVSKYTDANKRVRVCDVQLTAGANYTTGGETITAAAVGLNTIQQAIPNGNATTTDGATARTVQFLFTAGTLNNTSVKMVVSTTGSAQAASNSDQSTYTVRVTFIGR